MSIVIPFGEWLPDQPDFRNPGSSEIYNVLSRTDTSYGPMQSLAVYSSNALTARCQGVLPAIDSSGNIKLFAGDVNNLYILASGAWSTVSKGASPYACPTDSFWSFAQFGQSVYAANIHDPTQVRTLGGANFADLAGGCPKAKYLAVVKDFLVCGFTDDGGGPYPQRLHWSAINNPASFPTVGTSAALAVQSDYQEIPGNHGWLQGIVPNLGYADAAIFFERAIFRMQYVGYPAFFSFTPAEGVRGTPAPYSITQLGATTFYLGEDGFYSFDGANSSPIGANKVDRFFFNDVNQTYMYRVQGAVDPLSKIVYFFYTAGGINLDRALAFNVVTGKWTYINGITCEFVSRLMTSGYTLEGLAVPYPSIESIPFSLDSRAWTGGKVVLGAFDTSHKLNFFSGTNLAATMETSEVQPNPNGRYMITNARPAVEGNSVSPTVNVAARNRAEDSWTYQGAQPLNAFGTCPQHVSGRYIRAEVGIAAGQDWTHAQGVEIDGAPTGGR